MCSGSPVIINTRYNIIVDTVAQSTCYYYCVLRYLIILKKERKKKLYFVFRHRVTRTKKYIIDLEHSEMISYLPTGEILRSNQSVLYYVIYASLQNYRQ